MSLYMAKRWDSRGGPVQRTSRGTGAFACATESGVGVSSLAGLANLRAALFSDPFPFSSSMFRVLKDLCDSSSPARLGTSTDVSIAVLVAARATYSTALSDSLSSCISLLSLCALIFNLGALIPVLMSVD